MSWRLVSSVLVYITTNNIGDKFIAISGIEKKEYSKVILGKLKSLVGSTGDILEETVNSEEVKVIIKFGKKYPIKIKINSSILGDNFYSLVNFDYSEESLLSLLSGAHINCGELIDRSELIINSDSGLVRIVQPSMSIYHECRQELIRRTNCEIYKKTTKWIPGHRYDSLDETLIYLGPVLAHVKNRESSEFIQDEQFMEEYHLVISGDIDKKGKTLVDIIKNSILNKSLSIINKTKLMVDSGEVLNLEKEPTYNELIDEIIVWVTEGNIKSDDYYYCGLSTIFQLLMIESKGSHYVMNDYTKHTLVDYIRSIIRDELIPYNWDKPQSPIFRVCSTKSVDDNVVSCFNILVRKIDDNNIKKQEYIEEFFNYLNIDIKNIIRKELLGWSPHTIINDFDKFCEYSGKLFELSKPITVSLRTSASSRYNTKKVTLSDTIQGDNLIKIIQDIVIYTRKNKFCSDVKYRTENVGTIKSPMIYECFIITLNNILNYYNNCLGLEIPENLKNEIIFNKFCQVEISVDKDGDII